jgi:hypothetical protein
MKAFLKWSVCATSWVVLIVGTASAGVITHSLAIPPGPNPVASGPGMGAVSVPIVNTLSPNNDNVPGALPDNNVDINLKRFDFADYIDIVFTVDLSGATTEYRVAEFVDNNTGVPWSQFVMQLGTGSGLGFTLATPISGLDFDDPTYDTPPTSTAMTISSTAFNQLVFSGFHGPGAQQYNVRIDVPDLLTRFSTFTLRQFPIRVPEPGSLALVGIGLAGLAFCRRGR